MNKKLEDCLRALAGKEPESIAVVLSIFAQECFEIAEHVRGNWQDEMMAKKWDKRGAAIARAHEAFLKNRPF